MDKFEMIKIWVSKASKAVQIMQIRIFIIALYVSLKIQSLIWSKKIFQKIYLVRAILQTVLVTKNLNNSLKCILAKEGIAHI